MNNATLTPLPQRLGALLLIVTIAAGCSGRLDEKEAADATQRAATLYPNELTRRAPRLTRAVIREAISNQLGLVTQEGVGALLVEDDLNLDKPRFVSLDGANEEAFAAAKAICADVPRHDLALEPYPCEALEMQVKRLGELMDKLDASLKKTELDPEQTARIRDHLLAADPETVREEDGSVSDATLIRLMFGAEAQGAAPGLLPEALVHLEGIGATIGQIADTMARVEINGHHIYMQLAWDLKARQAAKVWQRTKERYDWMNDLADRELKRTGEPQPGLRPNIPADWPASPEDAQQLSLRASMSVLDRLPIAQATRLLQPGGDQYTRLLAAHDRYKAIIEAGGFEEVPDSIKLRRGRSKDLVAIRKRLRQEGFEAGDGGEDGPEVMDKPLRAAIKAFQRAHQLKDRGKLNDDTLEAMAIPARDKLARVRLALSLWRETTPRGNYYVYVNIPDYHGEVWKDGERQHRFRVVVGNAKSGMKDGKRALVNATRAMDAEIDRVVLNPYWNVPSRIFKREIMNADMKEMEADDREDELSSRGYQLMGKGTRGEWVRQPPGPGNALGQVKIIFPNPHETYLHDTPSKSLFKRPRRAFSHGCVRVHEPLRLARMLLKFDGQYDAERVNELLRAWENHKFFLKRRVPIHVEYITVRVDDRGVVHFLNDVYGHDASRMAMK